MNFAHGVHCLSGVRGLHTTLPALQQTALQLQSVLSVHCATCSSVQWLSSHHTVLALDNGPLAKTLDKVCAPSSRAPREQAVSCSYFIAALGLVTKLHSGSGWGCLQRMLKVLCDVDVAAAPLISWLHSDQRSPGTPVLLGGRSHIGPATE